jgi:hypothetical protein
MLKDDLMAMFKDFHDGKLDIFRLNFAILTLIPKEPDASSMKKFRPSSEQLPHIIQLEASRR